MRILAFLVALLTPVLAFSQGAIQQSGPVVAGHPLVWFFNGIAGDAGPATNGILSGIGVQNPGNGICQNSGSITGTFSQICLGFSAGVPTISTSGPGAGNTLSLNINGNPFTLPGSSSCIGCGTMAGQNANAVAITGGNISSATISNSNITGGNISSATISNSNVAPIVATNAALKALAAGSSASVYRTNFTIAGDGGAMLYNWSSSACSLNTGAGDNGLQVAPTSGTGCWNASFPAAGVSPMVWGPSGNGTTDDHTALQNALIGAAMAGVPLVFDSVHLFNLNGNTLTIVAPIKIIGPYRYGVWAVDQPTGANPRNCPWGLVNKGASATMINATAITGVIDGVCLDTTGNDAAQASSGAAIKLAPPSSTTYQAGWRVENNTILNPFDGITLDGNGGKTVLGIGGTADPNVIAQNTIVDPLDIGISIGRNTAAATQAGNTIRDNAIVCGSNGTTPGLAGVAVFDGDITYDGTQNGPLGCNYGMMITPSTFSGVSQYVGGNFKGQFGDQDFLSDLYIKPGNGGHIDFIAFETEGWAAAQTTGSGTDIPVVIDCTTSGSACNEITITGLVSHAGNGTVSIVDVEAGVGGPNDFSLLGSTLCSAATPAAGSQALKINFVAQTSTVGPGHFIISGNRIGAGCHGSGMPNGITLAIGGTPGVPYGDVIITGNDLSGATQAINYTPTSTDHVIITNNLGVDEEVGTIASATSITLPSSNTISAITGTTTITTITGAWWSRHFTLIPTSSDLAFNTGGNLCNAITTTGQVPVSLFWNGGESCWNLK